MFEIFRAAECTSTLDGQVVYGRACHEYCADYWHMWFCRAFNFVGQCKSADCGHAIEQHQWRKIEYRCVNVDGTTTATTTTTSPQQQIETMIDVAAALSAFQNRHESFDYVDDVFETEMSALKYAVDRGQDVEAAAESLKVYERLRAMFDAGLVKKNKNIDSNDELKTPAQVIELVESVYRLPVYGEQLKAAVGQLEQSYESMSRHYERNFVVQKTLSKISNWIFKTYEP